MKRNAWIILVLNALLLLPALVGSSIILTIALTYVWFIQQYFFLILIWVIGALGLAVIYQLVLESLVYGGWLNKAPA